MAHVCAVVLSRGGECHLSSPGRVLVVGKRSSAVSTSPRSFSNAAHLSRGRTRRKGFFRIAPRGDRRTQPRSARAVQGHGADPGEAPEPAFPEGAAPGGDHRLPAHAGRGCPGGGVREPPRGRRADPAKVFPGVPAASLGDGVVLHLQRRLPPQRRVNVPRGDVAARSILLVALAKAQTTHTHTHTHTHTLRCFTVRRF